MYECKNEYMYECKYECVHECKYACTSVSTVVSTLHVNVQLQFHILNYLVTSTMSDQASPSKIYLQILTNSTHTHIHICINTHTTEFNFFDISDQLPICLHVSNINMKQHLISTITHTRQGFSNYLF